MSILKRIVKLYSISKKNAYKIIKISKKNYIVSKIKINLGTTLNI